MTPERRAKQADLIELVNGVLFALLFNGEKQLFRSREYKTCRRTRISRIKRR